MKSACRSNLGDNPIRSRIAIMRERRRTFIEKHASKELAILIPGSVTYKQHLRGLSDKMLAAGLYSRSTGKIDRIVSVRRYVREIFYPNPVV